MKKQNIKVRTTVVYNTAESIEGAAKDYQALYNKLYQEIGKLENDWDDLAYTTFKNQIEGFKTDLKAMYDLMMKYADVLRKSAKAYDTTQENAIRQAEKLKN